MVHKVKKVKFVAKSSSIIVELTTHDYAENGDNSLHPLPEIQKMLEGSPEGERFLHNLLLSTDRPKGDDKKRENQQWS